jgi:hypothetical protein
MHAALKRALISMLCLMGLSGPIFGQGWVAKTKLVDLLSLREKLTLESIRTVDRALPGNTVQFMFRVQNSFPDTVELIPVVDVPEGWSRTLDQGVIRVPGQKKRILPLSIAVPNSALPGPYTLRFGFMGKEGGQRVFQDYEIMIDSLQQIKVFPQRSRSTGARGMSDSAIFTIQNQGNTAVNFEVFPIGARAGVASELWTLLPNEKRQYRVAYDIPKTFPEDIYVVGCLVRSGPRKPTVTSLIPMRLFHAEGLPEKPPMRWQLTVGEDVAVTDNGYNALLRTNTTLSGQRQFSPGKMMRFRSNLLQLNAPQSTQQFLNVFVHHGIASKNSAQNIQWGTINPESVFYAQLPNNFIGATHEYVRDVFEMKWGGYQVNRRSTSDSVEYVGQMSFRIGTPQLNLASTQSMTVQQGLSHVNSRNYVTLTQSNIRLKVGTVFYDALRWENTAWDGQFQLNLPHTDFSVMAFSSPSAFIPGSENLFQTEGTLTQRIKQQSFSVSASHFQQSMLGNSFPQVRQSMNSMQNYTLTPKLRATVSSAYFRAQSNYNGSTLRSVNQSLSLELKRQSNLGTSFSILGSQNVSKQNGKSQLSRYSVGGEAEYAVGITTQSTRVFLDFTSTSYRLNMMQSFKVPIPLGFQLVNRWSLIYQPQFANKRVLSGVLELRKRQNGRDFGVSLQALRNTFGRNMVLATSSIKWPINFYKKPPYTYKAIRVVIVDQAGLPIPYVMMQCGDAPYITDKKGQILLKNQTSDSLRIIVNRQSLPFGYDVSGGAKQQFFVPDPSGEIQLQTFQGANVSGAMHVQGSSDLVLIAPDYSQFVVHLRQGDQLILRPLDAKGHFSVQGLVPGTWEIKLEVRNKNYKAFMVKPGTLCKALQAGETWDIQFDVYQNSESIRIQKGISR